MRRKRRAAEQARTVQAQQMIYQPDFKYPVESRQFAPGELETRQPLALNELDGRGYRGAAELP